MAQRKTRDPGQRRAQPGADQGPAAIQIKNSTELNFTRTVVAGYRQPISAENVKGLNVKESAFIVPDEES